MQWVCSFSSSGVVACLPFGAYVIGKQPHEIQLSSVDSSSGIHDSGIQIKRESTKGCHTRLFVDPDERDVLPSDLKDLPPEVLNTVDLDDNPHEPTITFRYFVLAIPGAFVQQMSFFRTTSASYSSLFVQVASNYVGRFLAAVLPAYTVRIPFTELGFNLNPGPWGSKEHVLVTVTASQSASLSVGIIPIALAKLMYDISIHPAACLFFYGQSFSWAIHSLL